MNYRSPWVDDELESFRQRPVVGEVVDRGQELAVREIAGSTEDHKGRRVDRRPLESLDEWVLEQGDLGFDGSQVRLLLRAA